MTGNRSGGGSAHIDAPRTNTKRIPLMMSGQRSSGAGLTNITWHYTEESPCDFEFARVGYDNSTLDALTIKGFVGVSSTLASPELPTTIVPLTFGGATSLAATAATSGREYNGARSADGGVATLPVTSYSDWMYIPSIARSDGGTLPIVHARLNGTTASAMSRMTIDNAIADNLPGTRKRFTFNKAGDFTAAAAWSSVALGATLFAPFWIEIMSRQRACVVMAAGDSITKGAGSGDAINGHNGHTRRACDRISTPLYPVVCVNTSWGGTQHKHWTATDLPGGTSLVFAGNTGISQFERNLQVFAPSIVVVPTWSPNNALSGPTPTADEFRRSFAQSMYMAQLAESYGARVIFTTPPPKDGMTGAGATAMLAAVAYALNALANARVVDLHAVWGNGAGGYIPAMTFDGTHPSELGYASASLIMESCIRSML